MKQSAHDDFSPLDVNAMSAVPENQEDPNQKVVVVSLSNFMVDCRVILVETSHNGTESSYSIGHKATGL